MTPAGPVQLTLGQWMNGPYIMPSIADMAAFNEANSLPRPAAKPREPRPLDRKAKRLAARGY